MDINKLSDLANQVKDPPKWLSRKLLVTVSLIVGLFWMFSASLTLILWQVTLLAGVWLICTTATDIVAVVSKQKTKEKLIEVMSSDGVISQSEAEVIEKI